MSKGGTKAIEKFKPPPQNLLEPKVIIKKWLAWKLLPLHHELIIPKYYTKYLLSTCYMPDIILDARDRGANKIENIFSLIVYILVGEINKPANT